MRVDARFHKFLCSSGCRFFRCDYSQQTRAGFRLTVGRGEGAGGLRCTKFFVDITNGFVDSPSSWRNRRCRGRPRRASIRQPVGRAQHRAPGARNFARPAGRLHDDAEAPADHDRKGLAGDDRPVSCRSGARRRQTQRQLVRDLRFAFGGSATKLVVQAPRPGDRRLKSWVKSGGCSRGAGREDAFRFPSDETGDAPRARRRRNEAGGER